MISAFLILASVVCYVWLMRLAYKEAKEQARRDRLKGIQRQSRPWEW